VRRPRAETILFLVLFVKERWGAARASGREMVDSRARPWRRAERAEGAEAEARKAILLFLKER